MCIYIYIIYHISPQEKTCKLFLLASKVRTKGSSFINIGKREYCQPPVCTRKRQGHRGKDKKGWPHQCQGRWERYWSWFAKINLMKVWMCLNNCLLPEYRWHDGKGSRNMHQHQIRSSSLVFFNVRSNWIQGTWHTFYRRGQSLPSRSPKSYIMFHQLANEGHFRSHQLGKSSQKVYTPWN